MSSPSGSQVALVALLLIGVATGSVFASTYAAHLSAEDAARMDVSADAYQLTSDRLVIDLELYNPTGHTIQVTGGYLIAEASNGTAVTDVAGVTVEETAVPSDETRETTARVRYRDEQRPALRAALKSGEFTVSGRLNAAVRDRAITIQVTIEGRSTDV